MINQGMVNGGMVSKGRIKANVQKRVHVDEGDKKGFILEEDGRHKGRSHKDKGAYI